MAPEIGHFALALALIVALMQSTVPLVGAAQGNTRLMLLGTSAAQIQGLLVAFAFGVLMHAHIVSDFSLLNVAENSHTAKPMLYKITGLWGNHEGSMLLWTLILAGFGFLVATLGRGLPTALKARTLAVQGMIGAAFLCFMLFAANPFVRLDPAPIQGNDLNPILQDPGLAFHPPILYLGYVGFSIVFAFAAAALIGGRVDEAFARIVRPWVLMAWSALTLGIALGSWWAYYELGWGGFWFWDPVENASLMPWLAGTALLHSVNVLEKRGSLGGWTAFLAIVAFSLSLLGTFLVRSGVLMSVHAFASDPTRGLFILAILALAVGGALGLFFWRAPLMEKGRPFELFSREGFLLVNNLLVCTAAVVVVFGTLYPLGYTALTGGRMSVGPPYFALMFVPLAGLAALLVPVGSHATWKHARVREIVRLLSIAAAVSVGLGICAAIFLPGHKLAGGIWLALAAWLIAGSVTELVKRMRIGQGGNVFARLARIPVATYGMLIAHAGLGIVIAGVAGVTLWKVEALSAVEIGGSVGLGPYTLTLEHVTRVRGPNYYADRGEVRVTRDGKLVATATPERRFYPSQRTSTTEAAIRTTLLWDTYIVLGEPQGADGAQAAQGMSEGAAQGAAPAPATRYAIRAYLNPLAPWIWLGAALTASGGVLSLLARLRAKARKPVAAAAVAKGA